MKPDLVGLQRWDEQRRVVVVQTPVYEEHTWGLRLCEAVGWSNNW